MFNLLVGYAADGAGRETISLSRVFEYTDDEVRDAYRENGRPALSKIIRHPCLFMHEGVRDELAYVGTITQARISGAEVTIEFTYDAEIPPFTNNLIYTNKHDFGMPHDFEFSRTHWAVKDIDLFRVLLRLNRPRRQRPVVFSIGENERIEPSLISVMMPFDPQFNPVYESLQAVATRLDVRCRRADEIWENPAIIQDIVSLIDRSRIVICDCTGRNPNVFYEIGIAHTLGLEVIMITQNGADIPFDLRHLRYVSYLNNAEGRTALSAALETRLADLLGA